MKESLGNIKVETELIDDFIDMDNTISITCANDSHIFVHANDEKDDTRMCSDGTAPKTAYHQLDATCYLNETGFLQSSVQNSYTGLLSWKYNSEFKCQKGCKNTNNAIAADDKALISCPTNMHFKTEIDVWITLPTTAKPDFIHFRILLTEDKRLGIDFTVVNDRFGCATCIDEEILIRNETNFCERG